MKKVLLLSDSHGNLENMMNPGSIGAPPYGIPPSYGILEIDGANHKIHMKTGYLT